MCRISLAVHTTSHGERTTTTKAPSHPSETQVVNGLEKLQKTSRVENGLEARIVLSVRVRFLFLAKVVSGGWTGLSAMQAYSSSYRTRA